MTGSASCGAKVDDPGRFGARRGIEREPWASAEAFAAARIRADDRAWIARQYLALVADQYGRILYSRRFDRRPAQTPVDIRSAGKSLTALAVGAAIADGKLADVNLKVWPYLGASRGEPFDSITLRDLLTTAGFQGAWAMQGNGGNYVAILREYDAVLVVQAENYNRPRSDEWSLGLLSAMLAILPAPTR